MIGGGGGGGGKHSVLFFSFVVVLYSIAYMQLLKRFSLMKEVVMCNNNLGHSTFTFYSVKSCIRYSSV